MLTEETQNHFYKRLGELIKNTRNNAGVSQETLANYLGLTRVSILNIEKGRQKVQIHTLVEIVTYLNIPIADFFEKVKIAVKLEVSPKLEKEIIKKIDSEKIDEINRVKEFISFTISKK